MNRSGKKCVLYPRVSTEMQVDGFSLDGQKSNLRRFADRGVSPAKRAKRTLRNLNCKILIFPYA